jgi:hypothetical protein
MKYKVNRQTVEYFRRVVAHTFWYSELHSRHLTRVVRWRLEHNFKAPIYKS